MKQKSQGLRRGAVFSIRLTQDERAHAEKLQAQHGGPKPIGAWMRWRALNGEQPLRRGGLLPAPARAAIEPVIPTRCRSEVLPGARPGSTSPARRIILDLCGGSGSWSNPYSRAGYDVKVITLPEADVRTYVPPPNVWGVIAAPPCTEFSLAKNGQPRDFATGMDTVNACMRIIFQSKPRWWALENPTGYLSKFLGTPADVWEPHHFGDPWTKRTAIWGEFQLPERGPFIAPEGSAMDRPSAALRAVTPPGFACTFFAANP